MPEVTNKIKYDLKPIKAMNARVSENVDQLRAVSKRFQFDKTNPAVKKELKAGMQDVYELLTRYENVINGYIQDVEEQIRNLDSGELLKTVAGQESTQEPEGK